MSASQWIDYADSGIATLTHYTLPSGYVASCGCTPASTEYPTVALSQSAFGSSQNYGPACGRCFRLTLINPVIATPPFFPPNPPSIIVKVTDLCPLSQSGWCSGTPNRTNPAGAYLNFDLAWPSAGISDDFFPSDQALYGYKDFGVWNISYQSVSCLSNHNWPGSTNAAALGSVKALESSACCPADPGSAADSNSNITVVCPSFSEQNGVPPDTSTSAAPPHLSLIFTFFASTSTSVTLIITFLAAIALA